MTRLKHTILTGFLIFSTLWVRGQSTNITRVFQGNFKKAEELYGHMAYRNALELYREVVRKDSSNLVARERTADCYYRLGNFMEAERWYAALAVTPDVPPVYKYQYAQVLAIQGKYEEAEKWFSEYAGISGDTRARSKSDFLQHLDYYFRDSLLYQVRNEAYNSDQSDFAPQYYGDGVVFVSARDRDMFIKHQSASGLNDKETMLNIYFAARTAAQESDAVFFQNRALNSAFHDGPITFFDGYRKAAFSRNNLVSGKPVTYSGKINLKLYFGELDAANAMKNTEPFTFNDDAFSVAHPWVSEDGLTLYFASNQPGGEGGVDLYMSEKEDGKWTAPKNLGPGVNTLGDEFYPFLLNDTTLYFSSTGHGGFGGLDIYVSYKHGSAWSKPQNPGYPLNSSGDDFSLVMDPGGRKGMFSSSRAGGVGYDDIYSFEAKSFLVTGRTVERNDSAKIVADAAIVVTDESHQVIDSTRSDERGYFYVDLPFDETFSFRALKKGFTWMDTLHYSTHTRRMGSDSIVVALWKHSMFARGIIYSNESQGKLTGVTVILKNITDGRIDSILTDLTGAYNFLVKPNRKYVISAVREGFISREFELSTAGLTSGDLLNDMLLEEVFLEKVVVQFDFEKWDIKPAFHASLDKVVRVMKRNRKYHLHIGAYADSHGTHEFNLDLSNKRAREVVMYLENHGIDPSRITAIGFGEELLLNHCSNGVICSEEEHAKNRRAELKVQLLK